MVLKNSSCSEDDLSDKEDGASSSQSKEMGMVDNSRKEGEKKNKEKGKKKGEVSGIAQEKKKNDIVNHEKKQCKSNKSSESDCGKDCSVSEKHLKKKSSQDNINPTDDDNYEDNDVSSKMKPHRILSKAPLGNLRKANDEDENLDEKAQKDKFNEDKNGDGDGDQDKDEDKNEAEYSDEYSDSSSDSSWGPKPIADDRECEKQDATKRKASDESWRDEENTKKEAKSMKEENISSDIISSSKKRTIERTRETKRIKTEEIDVHLINIPTNAHYEISYKHTHIVTHVLVCNKKNYFITASENGQIKFWYRNVGSIEFIKSLKVHSKAIISLFLSEDETWLGSISLDGTYKQYDVSSFDMTLSINLDYIPEYAEFIYSSLHSESVKIAISSSEQPTVYIYRPLETIDETGQEAVPERHDFGENKIQHIKYNKFYHMCVLIGKNGVIDVVDADTFAYPKYLTESATNNNSRKSTNNTSRSGTRKMFEFKLKSDTSMFELCKHGAQALSVAISNNGDYMAIISSDFHLRIFKFATMTLYRVYDESIQMYTTAQNDPLQKKLHMDGINFDKGIYTEKDFHKYIKERNIKWNMVTFDESDKYIIYSTMIGIKVVNTVTNQVCCIIGYSEQTLRYVSIALYQRIIPANRCRVQVHSSLYINDNMIADCALISTAHKKDRFYIFTKKRLTDEDMDRRDIMNERPKAEELNTLVPSSLMTRLSTSKIPQGAIIYTTMGEIHITLFYKECKKTVQNFAVHSENGYYDNCIFHRVIKRFMIQTGDPSGDGTGGQSIWGTSFEDEFSDHLNHALPFTVSMANCGPNTNGSQFFITTVPCPWLDSKHTVFGRVTAGTEVVLRIERVKTDSNDKPIKPVSILNIKILY